MGVSDATPKPVNRVGLDKSNRPPSSLNQVKQPKQLKDMRKLVLVLPRAMISNSVTFNVGVFGAGTKIPLMPARSFKDVPGLSILILNVSI